METILLQTDIFRGEVRAPEGKAMMWFTHGRITEIRAVLPSWAHGAEKPRSDRNSHER